MAPRHDELSAIAFSSTLSPISTNSYYCARTHNVHKLQTENSQTSTSTPTRSSFHNEATACLPPPSPRSALHKAPLLSIQHISPPHYSPHISLSKPHQIKPNRSHHTTLD